MGIYKVILSKKATGSLEKVPSHIVLKLQAWTDYVEHDGLSEARKIPGFHDEPLKGKHQGQRSIRLNKSYRAIYEIKDKGDIHFVDVIEVNKHEY